MTGSGGGRQARASGWALAIVFALLLATGCSKGNPQTKPTPGASSPGGTAGGTPGSSLMPTSRPKTSVSPNPAAGKVARKVVYQRGGDLWLYTPATNSVRRLTKTSSITEHDPKFIDADRISYFTYAEPHATFYEMRLSTRATRVIVKYDGNGPMVHAWSPARSTIAYLTQDHTGKKHDLRFFVPSSRKNRVVRSFGAFKAREVTHNDSIHVEWQPDGKAVLVVMTPLDNKPTLYVVRGTGEDVIPPHYGTFARYSRDGTRIFYREFVGQNRWFSLTVPGNVATLMHATPNTVRPSLSPDGTMLAFDNGGDNSSSTPSVYVYTIATKTQRRVGAGVDPLWLSDTTLAVKNTVKCVATADNPCMDPYDQAGTVDRLTLSGTRKRLSLRTTSADVLFQ